MPLVRLEVRQGRSATQKQALLDAAHAALVEVTMFAGRSRQAKRRLYQALVRNFGELGVAPADVFVVVQEPPLDNWGIRGGQMASEVDLGFEVQV